MSVQVSEVDCETTALGVEVFFAEVQSIGVYLTDSWMRHAVSSWCIEANYWFSGSELDFWARFLASDGSL